MEKSKENVGYEVDKWYLVEIGLGIFIPAKFIGLKKPCPLLTKILHDFPHPAQAVFENVKIYGGCGFKGVNWDGGKYTNFTPAFREVTESELWAVEAIEEFQKMITERKKSFSIIMRNGFRFEGKIKHPKKRDNLAGEYYAQLINPETGEKKEGKFEYDGSKESVQSYLLSKLPRWHIVKIEQRKISSFGVPQKGN